MTYFTVVTGTSPRLVLDNMTSTLVMLLLKQSKLAQHLLLAIEFV